MVGKTVRVPPGRLSRRGFCAGLALAITGGGPRNARAALPHRIAALDWAGCEMLVALGIEPVAVADSGGFSQQFPHSALPPGTVDLGARWEPNLELLGQISPDAILVGGKGVFPAAEKIVPPLVVQLYDGVTPPLVAASRALLGLGQALSAEASARRYVSEVQSSFERLRKHFAGMQKSVLVMTLEPDGLDVVIHGKNGLVGNCLERVGLQNAWADDENRWGFRKTGVEQLLRFPHARVLVIDQGKRTDRALRALSGNRIWQMIVENTGTPVRLRALFPFGGLPTAWHFALGLEAVAG